MYDTIHAHKYTYDAIHAHKHMYDTFICTYCIIYFCLYACDTFRLPQSIIDS